MWCCMLFMYFNCYMLFYCYEYVKIFWFILVLIDNFNGFLFGDFINNVDINVIVDVFNICVYLFKECI